VGNWSPEQIKLTRLDLECELDALLDRQAAIETALALLDNMKPAQPQRAEVK
jgi:hypothetical protein